MKFNYYYGSQAEQFSFVRIPRVMLTDPSFQSLSMASKVLYGVLLDRMSLSMKNGWFDEENRVYIIYQIGEIMEDLGFTKKKAMDLLSELEIFGLLEKKRRGHGLPNILYVKSFMSEIEARGADYRTSKPVADAADISQEQAAAGDSVRIAEGYMQETGSRGNEMGTSDSNAYGSRSEGLGTQEVKKSALQEVPKPAPLKNQTNNNYTYKSQRESNLIGSASRLMGYDAMRMRISPDETAQAYRSLICENIEYDSLLISHEQDRELIDGIVDLLLETVLCRQEYILIASNQYPAGVVRSKLLKLNYSHIEYVLDCLRRNTTKVNNIRKYLLAALFNAPSTIDGYYQAEVHHDMPQLAWSK